MLGWKARSPTQLRSTDARAVPGQPMQLQATLRRSCCGKLCKCLATNPRQPGLNPSTIRRIVATEWTLRPHSCGSLFARLVSAIRAVPQTDLLVLHPLEHHLVQVPRQQTKTNNRPQQAQQMQSRSTSPLRCATVHDLNLTVGIALDCITGSGT